MRNRRISPERSDRGTAVNRYFASLSAHPPLSLVGSILNRVRNPHRRGIKRKGSLRAPIRAAIPQEGGRRVTTHKSATRLEGPNPDADPAVDRVRGRVEDPEGRGGGGQELRGEKGKRRKMVDFALDGSKWSGRRFAGRDA